MFEIFQRERPGFTNWIPVFFAFGVGLYFSLSFEPDLYFLLLLSLSLWSFVAYSIYRFSCYSAAKYFLIVLALISSGLFSGSFRTHSVAAPVLKYEIGPRYIEGRIEAVEPSVTGQRYLITNLNPEAFRRSAPPTYVRLKSNLKQEDILPGAKVRAHAVIRPPSQPTIPGGFNFARHAFYQEIGGVGFILGKVQVLNSPERGVGNDNIIAQVRQDIVLSVEKNLEGNQRSLAITFMTGQKGNISRKTNEIIRNSGLAHLLAISGLHMGLAAGIFFYVFRFLLALVPPLALRFPIKKIAAVLAILFCYGFLLLINSPLSAQRAFIMVTIGLCAIVLDRKAFSIRTVSVAALVLMVLNPEVLISVSFQLSFAAVLGLVAFFEWYPDVRGEKSALKKIIRGIKITCLCSLIASLATAPIVLYHFHTLPLYGIIANLLAVPYTAFVIMPLVLINYLLMPFGMEGIGLFLLGQAFEVLLVIAQFVADLPGGVIQLPSFPMSVLLFAVCGGIFLCLVRNRIRFLGMIFIAIFIINIRLLPDNSKVLVNGKGDLFGVSYAGKLYLSDTRKNKFTAGVWSRNIGTTETKSWQTLPKEIFSCDPEACILNIEDTSIVFVKNSTAYSEECSGGKILITQQKIPRWCQSGKGSIGSRSLWKSGAQSFSIAEKIVHHKMVREYTGERPWSSWPQ